MTKDIKYILTEKEHDELKYKLGRNIKKKADKKKSELTVVRRWYNG